MLGTLVVNLQLFLLCPSRFSSLKRARSVSPELPDSVAADDLTPSPGSAKSRRYLADLARKADMKTAANGSSNGMDRSRGAASASSSSVVHSDKLDRARRIAAARAARNTIARGDIHSRLGVRRGGASGAAARSGPRQGARPIQRSQRRGGGQAGPAKQAPKVTVADLDSQLEEYMEGGRKAAASS